MYICIKFIKLSISISPLGYIMSYSNKQVKKRIMDEDRVGGKIDLVLLSL